MKPKTIFIPHEITDEGSLPKVEGKYLIVWAGNQNMSDYFTFDPNDESDIEWWMVNVLFWLEEKEVPTDGAIIYHIKKSFDTLLEKERSLKLIDWFKSKLGI